MAHYKNISVGETSDKSLETVQLADALLRATDWTQLTDSGLTTACKTAFKTYRASLRQIRQANPDEPSWPDAPEEKWSS